MKERINENWPKIESEMQEMCRTCDEFRKVKLLLSSKCQIYEQQIQSIGKINAESGISMQESQQKIEKLNQVVALLTQQIAEKIAENSMLRVESDANKGGKVKDNNCQLGGNNLPDVNKFLEIKMNIPKEDWRMKETNKEQDVESYSEMENSENSDDIQVIEEAENEETESSLNEKQVMTCAWTVHDYKGAPKCCGRVFPSVEDLASHVNEDHLNADRDGSYICKWDGCKRNGEPFKNKTIIVNHVHTHTGERPYRCVVEGCGRAFADPSTLRLHRNTHSRTTFPCRFPGCPKVFSHEATMKVHYRVRHEGEDGFKCPVADCGKVFERRFLMENHCRSHTGERPFRCPFEGCGRSFAAASTLRLHHKIHLGTKYPCLDPECPKVFCHKKGMMQHYRAKHSGEEKEYRVPSGGLQENVRDRSDS